MTRHAFRSCIPHASHNPHAHPRTLPSPLCQLAEQCIHFSDPFPILSESPISMYQYSIVPESFRTTLYAHESYRPYSRSHIPSPHTIYPTSILYTLLAILLFERMHSLAHARVYLPKRALSSMLFLREARQSQLRLLVLVLGCAHQRRRNRHLARLFPQRRHVRHARLGRLAARTCGVPRLR